jgi:hypothetical protein
MHNMHRVARVMVMEFNIPKWYSTHIWLSIMDLLGYFLFLLQWQCQLIAQVNIFKPLSHVLSKSLVLSTITRDFACKNATGATATAGVSGTGVGTSQAPGTASEQNSST